jgi:hypothetical protein
MEGMGGLVAGGQSAASGPGGIGGIGSMVSMGINAWTESQAKARAARAEKTNQEFQAYLSEQQKIDLEHQAADRARVGNDNYFDLRLKQSQQMGSQRARAAAKGGSLVEGSHAAILSDTQFIGDIEAGRLMSNNDKAVWLIKNNAAAKGFESRMFKLRADQINPGREQMNSLTSSFGRIASSWYRFAPYQPQSSDRSVSSGGGGSAYTAMDSASAGMAAGGEL